MAVDENMSTTIITTTPNNATIKIKQLEKEIEGCRRVEAYLDKRVETQRIEKRKLQEDLSGALDNVTKLAGTQNQQKDQLRNVSIELVQTKSNLEKSSNIANELQQQITNQEDEIENGKKKILVLEEAIETHQRYKETSEKKLIDLNNKIQQLEDIRFKLIEETKILQDKSIILLKELEKAREDLKILYTVVDEQDCNILALEERENSMKQQLTNAIRAKEELDTSSNILVHVNTELTQLDVERTKLEEEVQILKDKNNLLRNDLTNVRNNVKNLQITIDEKSINIKKVEANKDTIKQRLDMLLLENEVMEETNIGEKSDYYSKLAKKDEIIAKLQRELIETKKKLHIKQLKSEEEIGVHNYKQDVIDKTTKLNSFVEKAKYTNMSLEGEHDDLKAMCIGLEGTLNIQKALVKDGISKENELNAKLNHWTQKAYDYKDRCEVAEKKLNEYSSITNNGDNNNDPQASFLQAAMNRKRDSTTTTTTSTTTTSTPNTTTTTRGSGSNRKWKIGGFIRRSFSKSQDSSEESNNENERMKQLEENKVKLEKMASQLRSDLVKQQTSQREELYLSERIIRELQSENDAYIVKNEALSKNCHTTGGNHTIVRAI